jgi:uncharacterized membrane protein SirB2
MTYAAYKFLHLAGVLLMMLCLGAIASHRLQGGTKENFKERKFFMMLHGIGLLVSFVAGFGLMAKAQFSFATGWFSIKLLTWLIVGFYPTVFWREKGVGKVPLYVLMGVVAFAIYIVEYKPF